jgi:cytosolic iron-sulfur protein assembly protein CIAO1
MSAQQDLRLDLIKTLSHPAQSSSRAWQAAAHPNSPLLAVASADKQVYVWSLRDFQLVNKIEGGHKRSVRCVDWKPAGAKVTLATGSFDAAVGIWEASRDSDEIEDNDEKEAWEFSSRLDGPDSEIKSVHFSPEHYSAHILATCSRDKSIWIWEEVEDGEWETMAVLQEHQGDVKCVKWCEGATISSQSKIEPPRIVGSSELLASASYDDTIRLWRDVEEEGDWACVSLLEGHGGTVWDLSWEKWIDSTASFFSENDWEQDWSPRLMSCSDDCSIKTWRRELSESEKEKRRRQREADGGAYTQRIPSTIRPTSHFETWVEDQTLPTVHVRPVYAVDWSRRTGLVVSCGGDGTIAVYRERRNENGNDTTWEVVALQESAHGDYEVNHVFWAPRRDSGASEEEVIISCGDEGDVRIWRIDTANTG